MTELEYFEALELAAQKLTRSIENYRTVDQLRAENAALRESLDAALEELAARQYLDEVNECSSE